ncbi:MAG: SIMPL domain-containing protein [Flavobacteriales bacterium]|nr:SIMPL domain-containing protein [Flavobacteriales bacterium]
MTKNLSAIIFGLAIVISAGLLGNAYLQRSRPEGYVSVTGLGEADFNSDLIVWEGQFDFEHMDLKQAYAGLEGDRAKVIAYLRGKGTPEDRIVFSAVDTRKNTKSLYSDDGRYLGEEFMGYALSQEIQIESSDVEAVEKLSREITELLNEGVRFYSRPPRYYFTKLADLKIEMISKATEDARLRAERIAERSKAELGDLVSAQMGIFQITGQNSDEEYSWGGTFNTSSKAKTASITMKLEYKVK